LLLLLADIFTIKYLAIAAYTTHVLQAIISAFSLSASALCRACTGNSHAERWATVQAPGLTI